MVGVVFDPAEFTSSGTFHPEEINPFSLQPASTVGLSPVEVWWLIKCEELYNQGLALKCPWMRRRMLDAVDTLEMIARSMVIQPQNLELIGPPIGLRGDAVTSVKEKGLSIEEVADIVRQDWRAETGKGYYVTGSITPSVYRDDCLFDGPDPDMPVKGLRKFRGAASQLFDRKRSTAELLSLEVEGDVIVARWKMNGVLRLPFRPKMPEVIGTTTYHLDENSLIYLHEETWQMSAFEAFFKTDWFCRKQGSGRIKPEATPCIQTEN
jgi:Uncharacterized conserved protein (DUF2358)